MASDAYTPEQVEELAEKVKLLETILNDSNQLVQMSYLEDMTMVYVNGTAKAFRGGDEDHHGRHCYEYMMGLSEQCPFCPLLTQGAKKSARTEVDNGSQVFSVKTMLGEWKGRPAFIEYAADVTPSRRAQQAFERQVQTLLGSIPEAQGIMHFDLTSDVCLSVNGASTKNLKSVHANVSVDEAVAQTLSFVPDELKRVKMFEVFKRTALIAAYENGNVEVNREMESYFDDGSVRWARVTVRIMQNPTNDHLECILYGMDISEEVAQRKAFEQRANHHLALFNALARDYLNVYLINPDTDTVHVLKLDGFVTSGLTGNSSTAYPYGATYNRYIDERVHPDDKEWLREAMSIPAVTRELAQTPEYIGSYRVVSEGDVHYYQFKYLNAENGEGILAGFQNIDATIAAERDQQEILKTALTAAEEANTAKSAFLSNVSHDIRTPLNAIIGFNDLAMKHLDDTQVTKRYLDKVAVSSNHLLSLINDVLDMSHIESGCVSLEEAPINLPAMFADLRTIIAGNAEAAGITLVFDTLAVHHTTVIGDELKIRKVLVNILGNAVKFTPRGGTVKFSVEERDLRSSDYAHFLFRIEDNGVGMSREFKSHAFEAFAREAGSDQAPAAGTGLGLSIVKNLVNMMDGTVVFESERGKGTKFTVSLHLKKADERAAALPGADGADEAVTDEAHEEDLTGKRILLVEDNELNREIAFEILKEAGFVVDTANDGSMAVAKVAENEPGTYDLVLMDVMMPVMNGYEATHAIRGMDDPARAGVPIIAVTANAFSSDRDEALAAGMDGHIAKPINVDSLITKMRELIQ